MSKLKLGNMQAYGRGVLLSIGGQTTGFPNTNPAAPPVNLNYGFSNDNAVNFTKYSVCQDGRPIADNPNFHSVTIWSNPISGCPVWFWDTQNNPYALTITQSPPFPAEVTCAIAKNAANCKNDGKMYIDCSKNTSDVGKNWCQQPGGITVQTVTDQEGHQTHNVVVGAPAQPPPNDPTTHFTVYLGVATGQPWTEYSVCSDDKRISLAGQSSFSVLATADSLTYPCTITIHALANGVTDTSYQFTVLKPVDQWKSWPPGATGAPPHDPNAISCDSTPTGTCWCNYIVETSSPTVHNLNVNPPGPPGCPQ